MLIGLGSHARVGKSTVADILERVHGYRQISFAKKLKELALAINPDVLPQSALNVRAGEGKLRTLVVRHGWEEAKERFPTVRTYLQELGVACRDTFGEDFWIEQAGIHAQRKASGVVISDVRFKSEAEAIKEYGGVLVNVTRPGYGAVNDHISEHDLDDWEWDYVLANDGTKEDLEYHVGQMIERLILTKMETQDAGRVSP
jgi:hypothetical protein